MLKSRGIRLAHAVSRRSRARKHALVMRALAPTRATEVLDVGVADADPEGWPAANVLEERYPWPERITALGEHAGALFRERYPAIRYVQGDGLALPFADGAFDVAYSNAVVEHVGDAAAQRRFAAELLRVGRVVVITTPNRRCPRRGAHAPAARALAAPTARRDRCSRASTPRPAATCARSGRAPCAASSRTPPCSSSRVR